MSELNKLAKIYSDMADDLTDTMMSLGPRPDDAIDAVIWKNDLVRLQSQSSSLRTTASNLTDLDSLVVLQEAEGPLSEIREAVKDAKEEIKRIASITKVLKTVAKFIEVGTAILTFAANPAVGAAVALIPAVDSLLRTVNSAKQS
jgi:hypothetical protein